MSSFFSRIISSTSILSIGHFTSALSMAGLKIFLLYISAGVYPEYSYIYTYYMTFQLIGLFNIHLILLTKMSNKDESTHSNLTLLLNALVVTAVLSILSSIVFSIIMGFSGYSFIEALAFVNASGCS